jgi:23S rRNA G2069 N7-methylase RlmK/C1962 C5-methylase RlmI
MVYRAIPPSFLKDCDLNNVNDMWKMLNDMGFHIAYEDDYSIICQVNADMDEYIEYKIDCYDDFDTVNFYEKAIKFVDKEEFGKELEKCVNERKHVDNPIFI